MTKARAKARPRSAARRHAPAPSQRELFRRAAQQLGVSASDYERADILAQIAELLMCHPGIGQMLAFKGGAIMTLIDGSPRLSADLDAVVVTGRAVRDRQVRAALLADLDGRRIVTDVGIVNPGRQSLQYPFVQVRSFSGLGDVNIRLEISWREAPLLPTEHVEIPHPAQRPRRRKQTAADPAPRARTGRANRREGTRVFWNAGWTATRSTCTTTHLGSPRPTARACAGSSKTSSRAASSKSAAICTGSLRRHSKARDRRGREASSS